MANVRAAAAQCLAAVCRDGASLSRQLPLTEAKIADAERPLLRELCYGTLRYYWRLQAMLRPQLKKPFKARDHDIFLLLCLGAYQLDYLRIPPHAALNNTVAACEKLGKPWAKALVNAILRHYQREGAALAAGLDEAQASAHPAWLVKALREAWPQDYHAILDANNSRPPLFLRVNARLGSREDYLQSLLDSAIEAEACAHAALGIRLLRPMPVETLPDFAAGRASVQDEAAQLCAELLQLAPGQRVLDACAAPGGKTCHLLESEAALAELVAIDSDPARLQRVRDNLQRLQLSATVISADAGDPSCWWDGHHFDRILLDAPCSATGVIRRHPDIKVHRSAADISGMVQQQQRLLQALWPLLAPGGLLLYATCSVLPVENAGVLRSFLATQTDAEPVAIDADWGIEDGIGRQILPSVDGPDGFYYALLRKAQPDAGL